MPIRPGLMDVVCSPGFIDLVYAFEYATAAMVKHMVRFVVYELPPNVEAYREGPKFEGMILSELRRCKREGMAEEGVFEYAEALAFHTGWPRHWVRAIAALHREGANATEFRPTESCGYMNVRALQHRARSSTSSEARHICPEGNSLALTVVLDHPIMPRHDNRVEELFD